MANGLVPDIGGQLARGLQIGTGLQQFRLGQQQLAAQEQQAALQPQIQALRGQALGGDQAALTQLAQLSPEAATQTQTFIQQQLANLSEQDRNRLQSVTEGALQAFNLPDVPSKLNFLKRRREGLVARGVPTQDTDEVIQLLEAGQPEQANALLQSAVQSGVQLGLIEPPSLERERLDIRKEELEQRKRVAARAEKAKIEAQERKILEDDVKASKTKFDQAAKIRAEVTKASDEFNKINSAFERVKASEKTAAGDIALIFNYMKMLDPGSVVREGEFATAQNATGVPERVRNSFNKLLTGERLGDRQRKEFESQAGSIFESSRKRQEKRLDDFTSLAQRFDLERSDVIVTEPSPADTREAQKEEVTIFQRTPTAEERARREQVGQPTPQPTGAPDISVSPEVQALLDKHLGGQ